MRPPIYASLEKTRHRAAPEASLYSYGSPPWAGRVEASRAIGRKLTRTRFSSEQNRAFFNVAPHHDKLPSLEPSPEVAPCATTRASAPEGDELTSYRVHATLARRLPWLGFLSSPSDLFPALLAFRNLPGRARASRKQCHHASKPLPSSRSGLGWTGTRFGYIYALRIGTSFPSLPPTLGGPPPRRWAAAAVDRCRRMLPGPWPRRTPACILCRSPLYSPYRFSAGERSCADAESFVSAPFFPRERWGYTPIRRVKKVDRRRLEALPPIAVSRPKLLPNKPSPRNTTCFT